MVLKKAQLNKSEKIVITYFVLIATTINRKQDPLGPQKLGSLTLLKIQIAPPIPSIFTPATIRNGFLIRI